MNLSRYDKEPYHHVMRIWTVIRKVYDRTPNSLTHSLVVLTCSGNQGRRHRFQNDLEVAQNHYEPRPGLQRKRQPQQKGTKEMNNENGIIVTAHDHAELGSLITFSGKVSQRAKWELRLLENKLKRAQIVPSEEIPPDVITMNTRAEFRDLESGERMEFTLVLPADENINDGKISVLAPLGTAMLGCRVGDTFDWHIPHGIRHLKVIEVHFHPEGSLQHAA